MQYKTLEAMVGKCLLVFPVFPACQVARRALSSLKGPLGGPVLISELSVPQVIPEFALF